MKKEWSYFNSLDKLSVATFIALAVLAVAVYQSYLLSATH